MQGIVKKFLKTIIKYAIKYDNYHIISLTFYPFKEDLIKRKKMPGLDYNDLNYLLQKKDDALSESSETYQELLARKRKEEELYRNRERLEPKQYYSKYDRYDSPDDLQAPLRRKPLRRR